MGVLGYMVESVELHGGECCVTWWGVGLHGGDCWAALWGVLGYMMGVFELYGGVLGYMVDTWWLDYMVGCCVTW